MIEVTEEELPLKKLERLREWLQDDRSEHFLECLVSEEAILLASGWAKSGGHSSELCRGGPIPPSAMADFKKAATFRAAIELVKSKLKADSKLITAKTTLVCQ